MLKLDKLTEQIRGSYPYLFSYEVGGKLVNWKNMSPLDKQWFITRDPQEPWIVKSGKYLGERGVLLAIQRVYYLLDLRLSLGEV